MVSSVPVTLELKLRQKANETNANKVAQDALDDLANRYPLVQNEMRVVHEEPVDKHQALLDRIACTHDIDAILLEARLAID